MKYRLLHIIDSLGHGGAEHQLLLNLSALDRTRFENFVCYLYPINDLLRDITRLGVHAFCLEIKGKSGWISGVWDVIKFIRAAEIDLIHASLYEAELIGGMAGYLSGVPVISSLVSTPTKNHRENRYLNRTKFQIARFLTKIVYRTCFHSFVAISQYVKNSAIVEFGIPQPKVPVIPRAVPEAWLDPEPESGICALRAELSLNGCYPVLLNIGRLVFQKGQRYLLQAMPRILASFPTAKLLIVGHGYLRDELESLIKELDLQNSVFLLGKSDYVKGLLLVSDLFIFPSVSEGFGVALLEAAALGKPCIASSIGPIPEIIEHGKSGLLVKPRDSRNLAEGILQLSSDRERAQALGQRAQETVLNQFLIENTIKKLEALYIQILSS